MTAFDELLARAEGLAVRGKRHVLGIVGAPASGKTTLAWALADALGSRAAVVGMDGFHLAQVELNRLGRAERKGAPDTFDAAGYVHLIRRLAEGRETVYAPEFRREIEEPIAGAAPPPLRPVAGGSPPPRHRLRPAQCRPDHPNPRPRGPGPGEPAVGQLRDLRWS